MTGVSKELNNDARMWAMFCHLGGFAGLIPITPAFGSIIAPLIFWQIKKNEFAFVDEHGKEAVNFQISILLYTIISIPLIFVCIGVIMLIAIGIINIVCLIIAAIKANNGEYYRYPFCIRFIK